MSSCELHVDAVRPFPEGEGHGVASVILVYGALTVHAKLMRSASGLWLSMPRRKGRDDQWYDNVYFHDRRIHKEAERLAIEAFENQTRAA